jgi:hypothetical protein
MYVNLTLHNMFLFDWNENKNKQTHNKTVPNYR